MIVGRVLRSIKRSIKQSHEEYRRRKNRPYMVCSFTEGISGEDLEEFAEDAAKSIKGRTIEISVKGPNVRGLVVSKSGLSTWMFKIDFNDYGHITGRYWITTENDDSFIPKVIAEKIERRIANKLDRYSENKSNDCVSDTNDDVEYYCPHCGAILNKQVGFDPNTKTWICAACQKQLLSDKANSDIVWFCDKCSAVLNEQKGFTEKNLYWRCEKCGFENMLTPENIKA